MEQQTGVTPCTTYELVCRHCDGLSIGAEDWIDSTCRRCDTGTLRTIGRVMAWERNQDGHVFIDPNVPPPPDVRRIEADWPR